MYGEIKRCKKFSLNPVKVVRVIKYLSETTTIILRNNRAVKMLSDKQKGKQDT